MRFRQLFAISFVLHAISLSALSDWPTWQHDIRRSGFDLQATGFKSPQLEEAWTWSSRFHPQPAWHGPAKWDAYAVIRGLPSMRSYDVAFHVVADDESVFFGTSTDDAVHCLDAASGRTRWIFTADAPVRVAPMLVDQRLFFGSDDGHAYCIDAKTGELIWKFAPTEPATRIINNGRFISPRPCRTGVVVDKGRAWFGCGMLPWQPSYLCCVDAKTGTLADKTHFVRQLSNKTLEGAPAVSSELVLFPQGRVAPQAFRRTDGKDLGTIKKSGGGSIVVVSLDSKIMHGPATDTRKGGISQTNPQTLEMVASYGRGNALIVSDRISYMLTDDRLIASDLVTRKELFDQPCDFPFALIGVGSTLFAGGDQKVAAFDAKTGKQLWERNVNGRAYGLAFSNGQLIVSTDRGTIHAFNPTAKTKPHGTHNPLVEESQSLVTKKVAPFTHPGLLGRWVFAKSQSQGKVIRNLASPKDAPNRDSATAENTVRFEQSGAHQAIRLDGAQQSLLIAPSHRQAQVPSKTITTEAWVRVDVPQKWGGIVGAVQDNGDFERGWLLGFSDQKFSFAIAGTEKNGRLTYLTAKTEFKREHWYHVAATYDGQLMKLFVNGELAGTSTVQAGNISYPPQAFYMIGAYRDRDEFHRMHGAIHEVRVYNSVLDAAEIKAHYKQKQNNFTVPAVTQELYVGPWLRFTKPGEAVVRWKTRTPSPTTVVVEKSNGGQVRRFGDGKNRVDHEVTLSGLDRNELYLYSMSVTQDGKTLHSKNYECDTFFDFSHPTVANVNLFDDANSLAVADTKEILQRCPFDQGLCVVLGIKAGRLAWELTKQSNLRVVCLDNDRNRVKQLRDRLQSKGVAGGRLSVHYVRDLHNVPLVSHCANLVTSEHELDPHWFSNDSIAAKLLRPEGGLFMVGSAAVVAQSKLLLPPSKPIAGNVKCEIVLDQKGTWSAMTKYGLAGAGEWTHLYGDANNSGFGGEELGQARSKDELTVQWVGRPGPRYQADRSGRKPSPLAVNGRLFLQGLDRIIALDSYNGTVLWALEVPGFQRFNVPRDSGNWCADRDFVFAAIRDRVWKIEAATGKVVDQIQLPNRATDGKQLAVETQDWGFVAREGDMLLGSSLPKHTSWTDFWGKHGWYDQRTGPETFKICSDDLFARSAQDGALLWKREKGVVINSTITVDEGVLYFVESRNAKVMASKDRRVGMPELWQDQFLVAIDANTGSTRWEKPINTEDGTVTFYMSHAEGRLVVVSSTNTKYFAYAFDDTNGEQKWDQSFQWIKGKGDHGKAMSRPAIVGDQVFIRPKVLSLKDGQVQPITMPGGGCGTYACTTNALFFRAGAVTMWDTTNGSATKFSRLRPDCWVSTIPAGGMLLSPEGGGGCSCGSWMETSIGFMPKAHRFVKAQAKSSGKK